MKRILVIDNHPVMLKYMTHLLEKRGHQVKTAEDGLSALDILETYVPDIIFCDMVMPRIDGEKLCRIVRSMPTLKDVFFVIVSGIAVESEIDFRGFGADLCIAKGPFNVMSEHVLNVLSEPKRDASVNRAGEILGLESIYPRSVAKELWRSKRHFEVILDHMSEGMLELTSDWRIVYVNPSIVSLTGMAEERILGTDFIKLFHESHKQNVREVVEAIDDCPLEIHENFPLLVNGKQVSLHILPVRDEDRLLYVVIMTDIGEKRMAEARLQQALKTEAIATLAGGIAHDYNNLLAMIMGNLSMAREEAAPHSVMAGLLQEAEQASSKARDLTHQLMTLSRGGYPMKELGSIESLLKEIPGQIQAHKGVEYTFSIQDDLWALEYDTRQMHYAISNVLINAVEAMPQGGTIALQAENLVIENQGKDSALRLNEGKHVRISIRDEGSGIPEEHLNQVFDPYFSTKERGVQKGMGMGLTTAYAIVQKHGGNIMVNSTTGAGTTVTIYLPASEEEVRSAQCDVVAAQSTITNKQSAIRKILVMDDEESLRNLAQKMLERLGYEVETVKDGVEAIETYKKHMDSGEPFDGVILDLTIKGGMGGAQAIKELIKIDPDVKAIVCSGYFNDPVLANYEEHGFRGAMTKPYQKSDLESVLKKVLG